MALLDPTKTTIGDLCTEALRECGAIGTGQTPLSEDINGAWARAQWMLQQWERKRWLVFQLKTYSVVATGAATYSMGPGGDLDTGAGSVRPAKIESAFLRETGNFPGFNNQFNNQFTGLLVDFPLGILQSMEDYNRIRLKGLNSFPGYIFMDPGWPLATVYPWPIPAASIYEVFVTVMQQLPASFANLATEITLPYEYYGAILYNLALRLRPKYGIKPSRFEVDELPGLARDSLNVLRQANTAIARLVLPTEIRRDGIYNIFGDIFY
jgi:hypothetical protein